MQTALILAESVDSCAEQSWLWSGLAEMHRLDGNPELAVEHGQQALKLALAGQILAELGQADL